MEAPLAPVILTYHSISDARSALHVPPPVFTQQMAWLKSKARVVPLEELVRALGEHKALPERAVVLTFDDGFEDFYFTAAPVLLRFGFPATVFLTTAYCGHTNNWPGQPHWVQEQPLMNWTQIGELAAQGFCFGAHSVTHTALTELPAADVEREIVESQREIESRTGRRAEYFCYPYGRWNARVRDIVKRHYRAACTTGIGVAQIGSDWYVLPRVDVHYLRRGFWFGSLFTPRLGAYLRVRRAVRRLRGEPEGYIPPS